MRTSPIQKFLALCLIGSPVLLSGYSAFSQNDVQHPRKRPHDWWQADWKKDSIPGISLDQAYEYLKGRKSNPVIVAIIDNCVDTAHEDLKGHIWTNTKEIPGNGIDDDHNGYVDDMHGWCFIANKANAVQTKQSAPELLVYQTWKPIFENIDTNTLDRSTRPQYDIYQTAKKKLFEKYRYFELAEIIQSDSLKFIQYIDRLLPVFKNSKLKQIPFATLPFSNTYDSGINVFFTGILKNINGTISLYRLDSLLKNSPDFINFFFSTLSFRDRYKYDTTHNYREIVGDDPNNFSDKNYGTPSVNLTDITGDNATFIAGIIAANRENNLGIKGIADNVLIMPLVTSVPGGGSISKDIVMAVRYAVDNGASVINMSFGATPWIDEHEKELREVFDYADKHNVLIVTSAGNDGLSLEREKYLMGEGSNGKEHDGFMRVGATTTLLTDSLVSDFSQFGETTVDIFAPGTAIYSTIKNNQYNSLNSTGFSCPVVAGVAALLKSYFPTLTAKQLKEILMKSAFKPDLVVIPPSHSETKNKMPFRKMSKSGGIVNAFNAVKLADKIVNGRKL